MSDQQRPPFAHTAALLLVCAVVAASGDASSAKAQSTDPEPISPSSVDSLLAHMSTADKVGQLFMLGFPGSDVWSAMPLLVELRTGGILLTTNVTDAGSAQVLTGALQTAAAANGLMPLLISVNHEGGNVQPIQTGMTTFGPQWNVGQIQPIDAAVAAACHRGDVYGSELATIGINMNLAPDIDVWDNPANTVIGERAFSSDPTVVSQLGAAYIEALQRHGVLAVGKHFPGHGSSAEDSHQTLPLVMHDRPWLNTHELLPFVAAIQANVAVIMVGHLDFPEVDPVQNRPASLSPVVVAGILRSDLGFERLVVTDDLGQMKAITAGFTPGSAAVQALLAGSDMLLSVGPLDNEREMERAVMAAIGTTISTQQLDTSVRRVLLAKAQARLLPAAGPSLDPLTPVCPPE